MSSLYLPAPPRPTPAAMNRFRGCLITAWLTGAAADNWPPRLQHSTPPMPERRTRGSNSFRSSFCPPTTSLAIPPRRSTSRCRRLHLPGALQSALTGQAFNLFNISNLSGYTFTLDQKAAAGAVQTYQFGQATARAAQTFGSAGPRAFQLAARFSF